MRAIGLFLCVVLLLAALPLLGQQEFPIGAYTHRPDKAVYSSCNFTWAVMMTDFPTQSENDYYYNQWDKRIIAMQWGDIYYPSVAQRLVIEAEQTPVNDLSKNFFLTKSTGQAYGNAWWANPALHDAGIMVGDAVPYWEYESGKTYIDSFLIKITPPGRADCEVVRLEVAEGATILASRVLKSNDFNGDEYQWFTLSFTLSGTAQTEDEERHQLRPRLERAITSTRNIDVRVYWYDEVETWLDRVIINDQKARSLYSGIYDQMIADTVRKYTGTGYPLMRRFMLRDEPNLSGFYPFRRVDSVLVVAHSNDPIAGRGRGFTASCLTYLRFMQEAKPHELTVDLYPIVPSIPSPSLSASDADKCGIPVYDYPTYTTRLQAALDKLVEFDEEWFGGYQWRKGLRPAIEATRAVGSKKGIWFIPQVHGILWQSNLNLN